MVQTIWKVSSVIVQEESHIQFVLMIWYLTPPLFIDVNAPVQESN